MWKGSLIALFAGLALAGCGHSKGSSSVASGWTRHHVAGGGFSIDVPAGWRTAEKLDRKSLDKFFKQNPDVAPLKRALASGLIKILALDPNASGGFATNVNVLVQGLGEKVPLSVYARENAKAVKRLTGTTPHVKLTRLPAGRCAEVSYEPAFNFPNGRKKLALLQYAFLRGSSQYVVTFTTLPSLADRYRTTFRRSAESFQFD